MSRANKVRATKVRQQGAATKQHKPGKAFKGPNLVAQRESSSKKSARKTAAAGRRKTA
jgi:hypothetical protein